MNRWFPSRRPSVFRSSNKNDIFGSFMPDRYISTTTEITIIGALYRPATAPNAVSCPGRYEILLNVNHFKPHQLSVEISDNYVAVQGKTEDMEEADDYGFISGGCIRRIPLPSLMDVTRLTWYVYKNGIMKIEAVLIQSGSTKTEGRIIPIRVEPPLGTECVEVAQ